MNILAITEPSNALSNIRPEAEILIGLHRGGDPVTVMTGRNTVYYDAFVKAGMRVIDAVPRRRFDPAFIRIARRTLRELDIHIAYLFTNNIICNTALAAIGLSPVLVTYRGQTGNVHRLNPASHLTHLHPRVDAICCVANAVRDQLRPHVHHSKPVFTVYKGHDLAWYEEPPVDLTVFGIPSGVFTVGCVANHRPRKGVHVLIDAMHRLAPGTPIHLLLVGQGMDNPALTRRIADGPAASCIHRAGFRTDVTAITSAFSCTVLPALRREGLPKTVIESMACGVPPIVTDTGGASELVIHGESGLMVPPGRADAIAAAILDLWQHPEKAVALGRNARQRIATVFNVQDSIAQTRQWFAKLHAENSRLYGLHKPR